MTLVSEGNDGAPATLLRRLLLLSESQTAAIPLTLVQRAIRSGDVELMGLVFAMLHTAQIRARVNPPAHLEEFQRLHLAYLPKCIQSPIDSEWCEQPYLAAHGIAAWLKHLWGLKEKKQRKLLAWKRVLARLYIAGDRRVRDVVVCGVLEHSLDNDGMRQFFADWAQHPTLGEAYAEALEYLQSRRVTGSNIDT